MSKELLFTASSLRDRQEGLIDCAAAPSGSIVPVVVIYGANASGKSNLIHAIGTMRRLVLRSQTQAAPGGGVPHFAFKLDDASQIKRYGGRLGHRDSRIGEKSWRFRSSSDRGTVLGSDGHI